MELMQKYAELIVKLGANVQRGEEVFISAQPESIELTRLTAQEAYRVGAKRVTVKWYDEGIARLGYEYQSKETLEDIHDWVVRRNEEIVDRKAVIIHIISDNPAAFEGIDPALMSAYSIAMSQKCRRYEDSIMKGNTRWTIAAHPNENWARAVFGAGGQAEIDRLWKLIASATRLNSKSPIDEWRVFQQSISRRIRTLNDARLESLHFVNSLGTNLVIGLPKDYVFGGGAHESTDGVLFMPNLPTEEIFTAPHKLSANGRVVASMPLIYQGNKIEDFWLEFESGRVASFGAKIGEEYLKTLINTDEGASYLGEVALVGFDSPIQNLKTLFYNTLFDENASCHLALGRAYPDCIKNGTKMDEKELAAAGLNYSIEHQDFMIGTKDLSVIGCREDKTELVIFEKGDWVF